jgi:hypothetical protein
MGLMWASMLSPVYGVGLGDGFLGEGDFFFLPFLPFLGDSFWVLALIRAT